MSERLVQTMTLFNLYLQDFHLEFVNCANFAECLYEMGNAYDLKPWFRPRLLHQHST